MFDFNSAYIRIKNGAKVTRNGVILYWQKDEEIITTLLPPVELSKYLNPKEIVPEKILIRGHIRVRNQDGSITFGWLPSFDDMNARDWKTV